MNPSDETTALAEKLVFEISEWAATQMLSLSVFVKAKLNELIINALNAERTQAITNLAAAILHGDDMHRAWLTEAAKKFCLGEATPESRSGTNAERAQLLERIEQLKKERDGALHGSGVNIVDSSTPETDALILENANNTMASACAALGDFARKLERERDEVRRQVRDALKNEMRELDWLEAIQTYLGYNVECCAWGVDFDAPYASTVREAIDQARKGQA